jgi:hypothetical protein
LQEETGTFLQRLREKMVRNHAERKRIMKICVYCSAAQGLQPSLYEKAEEFGRNLARRGHALVYGGFNEGIMGAVARGAAAEGGEIIAVVPEIFDRPEFTYSGCTRVVHTVTMRERKAAMETEADALAVLPGGIGTFDEFFEALVLKTLGQLDKPIGVYDMDGKCSALRALLDASVADGMLSEKNRAAAVFYEDGEAMLDAFEAEFEAKIGAQGR